MNNKNKFREKSNASSYFTVFAIVLIVFSAMCVTPSSDAGLKRFASKEELKSFVKSSMENRYGGAMMETMSVKSAGVQLTTASSDFSRTNIQVEGVDEADIVKNDGKYIYTVSGNKLVIIDAYPAETAKVLSETEVGNANEIFINGNRLVVFGSYYDEMPIIETAKMAFREMPYRGSGKTFIKVYDISDRESPVVKRNITMEGSYYDSRMIGDYVYAIINQPVYMSDDIVLPVMSSNGKIKTTPATEIYYSIIPDYSYTYTNIVSVNTQVDSQEPESKTLLKGYTQNLYVSMNNVFVTSAKQIIWIEQQSRMIEKVIMPSVPASIASEISKIRDTNLTIYEKMQKIQEITYNYTNRMSESEKSEFEKDVMERQKQLMIEMAKEQEQIVVHKISISNGNIEYKTSGTVPGHALNQFSMDEYNGYFRIATTTGEAWNTEVKSANHIYVLDENLRITGKLEDLAPGEKIYSARFMGNRAYLVTFKKVDPLFVIDLSDPTSPGVLGKLKIPGYSDYLHPYDENHVIGIGKEAVDAEESLKQGRGLDFAWYQGVKISLFDVTDVENPKEISKFNIGDRGTDSEALRDHKAFLFDKEEKLLVIPVLLAEIDKDKYPEGVPSNMYGDFVWQGAYVLSLDLENGFVLKGRISHDDNESLAKSGYYYSSPYSVKRSLYIGNVLYTLSDKLLKMNSLDSLSEISSVELPYQGRSIGIYY